MDYYKCSIHSILPFVVTLVTRRQASLLQIRDLNHQRTHHREGLRFSRWKNQQAERLLREFLQKRVTLQYWKPRWTILQPIFLTTTAGTTLSAMCHIQLSRVLITQSSNPIWTVLCKHTLVRSNSFYAFEKCRGMDSLRFGDYPHLITQQHCTPPCSAIIALCLGSPCPPLPRLTDPFI